MSKAVCVGSNYAKHIKETGSVVPKEPVLFIKPETALYDLRQPLTIPSGSGSVYHEVELAVSIGATLRQATEEHACKATAGYGVAFDLTLRDVQGKMKKVGQPQKGAKAFDNSYLLSGLIPAVEFTSDPQNTALNPSINGEQRQQGTTVDMVHKVVPLIVHVSKLFTLKVDDVMLTSTPDGVDPPQSGDELTVTFDGRSLTTRAL